MIRTSFTEVEEVEELKVFDEHLDDAHVRLSLYFVQRDRRRASLILFGPYSISRAPIKRPLSTAIQTNCFLPKLPQNSAEGLRRPFDSAPH